MTPRDKSRGLNVAPPDALGWTHVWGGQEEQVALSDRQAHALVAVGLIEYSGLYRVYRPREGFTLDIVKGAIG